MSTEPTAYNNDTNSLAFSIGMLGDARRPVPLTLCPSCQGTNAVDTGTMSRCPVNHDAEVCGVCYVTVEFAADWLMDLAEKCQDDPLLSFHDEEDESWLA